MANTKKTIDNKKENKTSDDIGETKPIPVPEQIKESKNEEEELRKEIKDIFNSNSFYLTVSASNNSYNECEVDLFGNNNKTFIDIKFPEGEKLIELLKSKKYKIRGFRYRIIECPFGPSAQLSCDIHKIYDSGKGFSYKDTERPFKFFTAYQQQPNQVDATGFEFNLGEGYTISTNILPKTTISLTFQLYDPKGDVPDPIQTGLIQIVK